MTLEKFHHTLPDGYELVLPRFEDLPNGVVRKTRHLDGANQTYAMLELILTAEDIEHTDDLSFKQLGEFMSAWKDSSEIDLGESSASPTS